MAASCHTVLFPAVVVPKQNGDVEVYNMPLENTSQKPGIEQQSLRQLGGICQQRDDEVKKKHLRQMGCQVPHTQAEKHPKTCNAVAK